jgi:hypothetical protein
MFPVDLFPHGPEPADREGRQVHPTVARILTTGSEIRRVSYGDPGYEGFFHRALLKLLPATDAITDIADLVR